MGKPLRLRQRWDNGDIHNGVVCHEIYTMDVAASAYRKLIFAAGTAEAGSDLSDLQKAMLDATPDCIKVISVDGNLTSMNRAGCIALGVAESSGFGMPWLPLLPQSVHEPGREALARAVTGETARFAGQSDSAGGTRYWDNLLVPVPDAGGQVRSILCVSRDVTAKTRLEKDLEAAIRREKLLSQEMRHRIKNVFSIMSGLILIAEKEAAHADATESATKILRGKIGALARASDAVFVHPDGEVMEGSLVDAAALVDSVLRPYAGRYAVDGDPTALCHNNMTTIALFLHELATNSVKYGSFSADAGRVDVGWTVADGQFRLTWVEAGGPPVADSPQHRGFGTQMVERIVQAAGGSVTRSWRSEGLAAELALPYHAPGQAE